jgi:hypothetical protein
MRLGVGTGMGSAVARVLLFVVLVFFDELVRFVFFVGSSLSHDSKLVSRSCDERSTFDWLDCVFDALSKVC